MTGIIAFYLFVMNPRFETATEIIGSTLGIMCGMMVCVVVPIYLILEYGCKSSIYLRHH